MNAASRVFLIALRVAIGWHFLYEGVFKIQSDTGAVSYPVGRWASQAATARLHDYIEQTPKPDLARVDAWYDEILKTFGAQKALGEDQKARLALLRDSVKLSLTSEEPAAFDWVYVHEEVLKAAPDAESERFTALPYLQASTGPFRGMYRGLVRDIDGVQRLTVASAHRQIDARYSEIVKHYGFNTDQQEKLATARDAIKVSILKLLEDSPFQTRLSDYKVMLARSDRDASSVSAAFSRERLDADRKKLDLMAAELLALVNEPLSQLAYEAQGIATVTQLGAGPIPAPDPVTKWIDFTMQWMLAAIGLCLMLGVFTRTAAVAAAAQLAMFYFASPPWPGLPAAAMGGHYMYVDRNLIEMIAALVIATTATGLSWRAAWRKEPIVVEERKEEGACHVTQ
jgi:uncharacterized membrane protein YphA (DoxX/SURF4 family)